MTLKNQMETLPLGANPCLWGRVPGGPTHHKENNEAECLHNSDNPPA
eukprot:CAMPEP_0204377250 /NCGR_PEP_ID=MMETSP0469-20131031/50778_1 /ASSEMBLY_ACC=CAM_ASM_000384 /TAXON_ID=2969 /ORGANISM="Oxyrrhis marina" /LENGTH=46 /DNA_ID= /DNA_START= /DNA_END= /DNA_ORIENTATION=